MNVNKSSLTRMILTQLEEFRQAIYDSLGFARDAVFELMDAVLTSPSIQSFVSLSQNPVFRRSWPSIYAALHDSRPNSVLSLSENNNRSETLEPLSNQTLSF
ncbi:hypothetical protein [uncultured Nostoc sp.]|uniref:hypothetical protein n=1 Tax=Nostoc sp. TaxID=1180 RepID=UPI0035CAD5F4